MKSKVSLFFFISLFSLILSACGMAGMDHSNMDMGDDKAKQKNEEIQGLQATAATKTITDNEFTLVAQERTHNLTDDKSVTSWTFNGSVPGPEIRVQEGEKVKINLKNELKDPVTIHWHGLPIQNEMDGIPGVTQNAVQPSESFTYEFTANVPGTYWYHSHQDGATQVDKGLYGSFIVEGTNQGEYDRDYTLVLDEWMSDMDSMNMEEMMNMESGSSGDMEGMDHSNMDMKSDSQESKNMEGMDHGNTDIGSEDSASDDMGHDMSMYDIYTINGKSGDSIDTLTVKEGEKVRLRLVNAGFMSHNIHLHGHDFKIISSDGQEIANPQEVKDQLISIAPGERYDIEFTADNPGKWFLECHGDMAGTDGMKTLIQYEGFSGESIDKSNNREELPTFDLMTYGKEEIGEFTLNQSYNLSYTMDLNTRTANGMPEFTINDKTYPDTENLKVREGDLVKVRLINNSKEDDHPMHLHGHFFQVLSKNGEPVKGSPIMKDTINLKPGEEYVVAFKADNPGNWMFHCHDLHHASAGMVTQVNYKGFEPSFTPNPEANNQPE